MLAISEIRADVPLFHLNDGGGISLGSWPVLNLSPLTSYFGPAYGFLTFGQECAGKV